MRPLLSPLPPHPAARRSRRGLTLIELAVALVVVALLAGMAYPSYTAQLARSRRVDARQALLELAQRLERFHFERGTYVGATLGEGGIYRASSSAGHYALVIEDPGVDSFAIWARPVGTQADDACAAFGIDHLGEQRVSADARLGAGTCWQ